LGQCLRRWKDSDYRTQLHLVNAGKYSSAVMYNFMYIHYRAGGSQEGRDKALWILFASMYSIWHITWDLTMDWSLLRPRARYFLLRNELSFPVAYYYVFIVVDIIGRSIWFIYLIPGSATVTLRSFLAGLIEMIRRVCWNNLRVENEQIGNTDSFKIIRDLPLPYLREKREREEGASSENDDGLHKSGIFASVRLASLRRKKGATTTSPSHADKLYDTAKLSHMQANTSRRSSEGGADNRSAPAPGPERPKSLLETLRDKLIPDATGPQYGNRLDQRGATKGDSGRDYAPRQGEIEGDSDLEGSTASTTADEDVTSQQPSADESKTTRTG
jgi:hypothetical protein